MNNIEILHKAIKKAEYNGWEGMINPMDSLLLATYPLIIFSHDFAKAFWGETMVDDFGNNVKYGILKWQYHLKCMVIWQAPLKYLEKFLDVE